MKMTSLWLLTSSLLTVTTIGCAVAQEQDGSKVVPVEIFACSYNEGMGPADLDAAVAGWSGFMDDQGNDNYAAWTLSKAYYGDDQDFDFLWLGAWTDGNAMGAGHDMWMAEGGEHQAAFDALGDCDAHVNLASINHKMPADGTVSDGVITFSNCNVSESSNYDAVAAAIEQWAAVLGDAGSRAGIYHWFPIYGGGGDDNPDFVEITTYANFTELGADYERMGNGELYLKAREIFGDMVDCDVNRVYVAKNRRQAQLR